MAAVIDSRRDVYFGVIPQSCDYEDLENKPAIDGVTLTKDTTKSDLGLADVFVYKGQKPTYADLPTSGNKKGDVWDVADTGNNYAWNGSGWDNLGGISQVKTLKQLGIAYNNVSTKSIAQAIVNKAVPPGTVIIGGVKLTDFPDSALVNAELTVKVMDTILNGVTVLDIVLTSLAVAPYEWIAGYRSDQSSADIVWLPMNIQYSVMPTATAYYVDKIIQYTGTTTSDYINGSFYKGISTTTAGTTTYSWKQLNNRTLTSFPDDFRTSGTLKEVADSMIGSAGAIEGMSYLGGISGACMPWPGGGNAECKVEFMTNGIAVLTLSSSNVAPYRWEYNTASGDYKWKKNIAQMETIPSSNLELAVGVIVQYIGTTNANYTNGYFYKCVQNGGNYSWQQCDVQPETTLPVSTNTTVMNNSAFEVSDNSGNVALQVDSQGNLRTSKFRSDITPKTGNTLTSGGAFEISDSDGNVAFKIDETGNIITKNFNSSLTTTNAVKSINNINGALTLNPIMGIYNKEISILANTRHVNPIIVDNFTQSSHRGAPDKTNNTIEAFELSRTRGFKMIECDVRYTSDDVFVLFHDETIGGKAISSYTWSELHTAYNYIPTVEETLKWAKAYGICVEFDCATRLGNKVTSFYNLIKKWRMLPNCMICGIESELVTLADIGLTDIPVVISLWGNLPTQANLEALSPKLKKFNAAFVSIDKDDLVTYTTAPDICHTLGYSVKSFTPTTKADTKTLFNMGVDMINVDATELWDIYTN